MSVSWECKAGRNDIIYFIDNCIDTAVYDANGKLDEENTTEYKVGDKVHFLDWDYEMIGDNEYTIIKFKDGTGKISSANETFLVTEDVWEGLKAYFKEHLLSKL